MPWPVALLVGCLGANALAAFPVWPVADGLERQICGHFGDFRLGYLHEAIDIPTEQDTRIVAAKDGIVDDMDHDGLLVGGAWLSVRSNGTTDQRVVYTHLDPKGIPGHIFPGTPVQAGQVLCKRVVHPQFCHLDFSVVGEFDRPLGNPLNSEFLGEMFSDITVPCIETVPYVEGVCGPGRPFEIRADDGGLPGYDDSSRDPWLIAGARDIVVKAFDVNSFWPPPWPEAAGICRIGYTVRSLATGVWYQAIENPWWLVQFEAGGVHFPQQHGAEALYLTPPTNGFDHYYIVTNGYWDPVQWTDGNPYMNISKNGCWNTQQRVGGIYSEDAMSDSEARFPDGRYRVFVRAEDRYFHADVDSMDVLVDNFAPYVEEVEVWSLETGRTAWRARWNPQGDGSTLFSVLQEEAVGNAKLGFRVKFSEYITGPGLLNYLEIRFHHAGGAAEYAGEVTIPPTEYCREFSGEVEQVQGSPSVTQAPFGRYQVRIRARDSAGNYLDVTPASPARRNANGTWSDAGYDPAADNPDTSHHFTVAPALWVVEGHGDRTYHLVGYRQTSEGLAAAVSTLLPGWDCGYPMPTCAGERVEEDARVGRLRAAESGVRGCTADAGTRVDRWAWARGEAAGRLGHEGIRGE